MATDRAKALFSEVSLILNESGANLMELSRTSGIGYTTLRQLKAGEGNPTVNMLDKVMAAMFKRTDDGRTCENCLHCRYFEPTRAVYGCDLLMACTDDPRACTLHTPMNGGDESGGEGGA